MHENVSLPRKVHAPVVSLKVSPIQEALQDFVLSRQAMRCTPATMEHYRYTAAVFVSWLERQGIDTPNTVTASHVRQWLGEDADRLKPASLHARARGVRTLLRFWHAEGYLPAPIPFAMPRLEMKRLPVLSREELKIVLGACPSPREKALILLLADSGIRRAEAIGLHWNDIDLKSGSIVIHRGKGGKARVSGIGAVTMRALLAYRRSLHSPPDPALPVWVSKSGKPMSVSAVRAIFRRLSTRAGLKVSPHALRRTFAIQNLRSGMDVLSLQRLLGHATLEMTERYAQQLDEDLLLEHKKHGLDSWL